MNILCVNPHYAIDPDTMLIQPPLGFGYIANGLRRKGHEIVVADLPIASNDPESLHSSVADFRPDCVAFTCVAQTYRQALDCARVVRQSKQDCIIVFGGPHVTFIAEECLQRWSDVDVVLAYDGEDAMVSLVSAIADGASREAWARIPGISVRGNEGYVMTTLPKEPVTEIDRFGNPERSLFDMNEYLRRDYETVIMTARGCPGRCSFCSTTRMGRKYRAHSIAHVCTEIEQVLGLGFQSVFFGDDAFAVDADRTVALCEEIIRRGLTFEWTCNMRTSDVSPTVLRTMHAAGAYRVFVGFESPDATTLRRLCKHGGAVGQLKAARIIRDAGLELHAAFMVGLPLQTDECLRRLMDYIELLAPAVATFNATEPRPGTPLYDAPERFGIQIPNRRWYESTQWVDRAVCRTTDLSEDDIRRWVEGLYNWYCGGQRVAGSMENERWP